MKKLILLAVIVAFVSGCDTTKKRTTQENQFTVNAVVKPNANGVQTVSVSTSGPNYTGPYNLNVSVASGGTYSSKPTNPADTQPPSKNVWYSSSNPEAQKVVMPENPPVEKGNGKNPNTNKVIWSN